MARVPVPNNSNVGQQLTATSAAPFGIAWKPQSNYLGAFSDTTRSQAAPVNDGDFIYNSDDRTFNVWDATVSDWRNMRGVLT